MLLDGAKMKTQTVRKGLRNPELILVQLRRWFPWSALVSDPECAHLIKAWSSGSLQRRPIREIFPGLALDFVQIRKPQSRVVGWSLDLQELIHLLSVAKFIQARKVLEIGTFDGFTALNLAANLSPGASVSTVDLPPGRSAEEYRVAGISNAVEHTRIGSMFRNQPEEKMIQQYWGDSTSTDWTSFGGPFDLILIDGCHEYSFVKSDSEKALRNLKPGGVIFWHDYGFSPSVSRAVDELGKAHPVTAIRGTRFACLRAEQSTT